MPLGIDAACPKGKFSSQAQAGVQACDGFVVGNLSFSHPHESMLTLLAPLQSPVPWAAKSTLPVVGDLHVSALLSLLLSFF